MRRSAKILFGFGFIEILCAGIALFVFGHIASPWGAGTLPNGFGKTEMQMDEMMNWEVYVLLSVFGAGLSGAVFLICGCLMYLFSKRMP